MNRINDNYEITEQTPVIIILPNNQTIVVEHGRVDVAIDYPQLFGINEMRLKVEAYPFDHIMFIKGGYKKYLQHKELRRRRRLKMKKSVQ